MPFTSKNPMELELINSNTIFRPIKMEFDYLSGVCGSNSQPTEQNAGHDEQRLPTTKNS